MLGRSNEQKRIESNAKVLKKVRILKGLSRKDLAKKLNVTDKAIEKFENARDKLSETRLLKILEALEISYEDFLKIKRGKLLQSKPRLKNVITNSDRRSYQKIITKEVRALKALRILRKLSQDKASYLCGYSRPTIGHIENGRIAVDRERIHHIVGCLGLKIEDFEKYLNAEVMRHEVIDQCRNKILDLPDEKLSLIKGIIDSLG
ncbi:MAG: helix-turn-helix transcriptional regulator [Bacteriovorax sp.]|nr:helix-turn-helix transcriptional regulator [Bacteriovorax sp.]